MKQIRLQLTPASTVNSAMADFDRQSRSATLPVSTRRLVEQQVSTIIEQSKEVVALGCAVNLSRTIDTNGSEVFISFSTRKGGLFARLFAKK